MLACSGKPRLSLREFLTSGLEPPLHLGNLVVAGRQVIRCPRELRLDVRLLPDHLGLEGIISKRTDTSYRSGPFIGWRKIKNPGYVRP